jgi:uncharacterized protein YjbJ (UPF0337 family)
MNKDTIKGKAKDIAGRVERQAGEWTDDEKSQAQGLGNQIEGKAQKAWGDLKDAGRKAGDNLRHGMDERNRDSDVQPEPKIDHDEEAA